MSAAPTPPSVSEPPEGVGAPTAAMQLAWHAVTSLALLASPLLLASDLARGRGAQGLLERLGASPRLDSHPAWIHAASVGELSVAAALLPALAAAEPDVPVVLSTMTATGRAAAARFTSELAAPPFHVPADAAICVALALARLQPRILLSIEAEIWPNLWAACARRGIPVALVNGRVSPRHFPRYRRARALIGPALRHASLLAMRTTEDAERILALGALPERVVVTGNLKFDAALPLASRPPLDWAEGAGLGSGRWLMLASTAEGEERPLLAAFANLRASHPDLRCVLAPRRQERWDEVAAAIEGLGLPFLRRSRLSQGQAVPPGGILLLDSLGELARLYRHATLVFVGGSLVPRGGQNLIEPAAAGKPVLFGPHVDNFHDAQEALLSSGGGQTVTTATFEESLSQLLADEPRRLAMGQAALAAVRSSAGAAARTVMLVSPLLRRMQGSVSSR